jgi:hypothetical protein
VTAWVPLDVGWNSNCPFWVRTSLRSAPLRRSEHLSFKDRTYPNWFQWIVVSATLDRPTTITVTEKTRRLLEAVKCAGESFDDMIQDLLEETFLDDKFYAEIERRWQTEKRVPGNRVMKKAGLV